MAGVSESTGKMFFCNSLFLFLEFKIQNSLQFAFIYITTYVAIDLEKRISDAFLIFDHQNNKTVDVREIGTILRYLGKNSFLI